MNSDKNINKNKKSHYDEKKFFSNIGPEKIILCKKDDDISIFKNENPYRIIERPKALINGLVFNPPFFKLIILNETVETYEEQVGELYNNVLMNGTFVIPKKYKKIFANLKNPTKEYKNYIMIHKKSNKIFKNGERYLDCLICGTQKASTTSALLNLRKHPKIEAHKEEIHFFDLMWKKGVSYLGHFYNKKMYGKLILSKNPDLLYLTNTHWMIQNVNPFIKLIIFLRNPISRAYSAWQMSVNNGWTGNTFEEAISEELKYRIGENRIFNTAVNHYLQRGLYFKQIESVMRYFPRQNIKIFIMEHFSENMEKEYNEIYEFLCLEKENFEYTKERINNYQSKIDPFLYKKLEVFFENDVKQLEEFLNIKTGWFDK